MISASDFLMTVKRKGGSKLLPFKEDIVTLKKANLSNQKICEFLKLNGVEVSHQRVAVFLKEQGFNNKNKRSNPQLGHRTNPAVSENQKVEGKEFTDENLRLEAEFAKPSWVPEHINIEDLK